MRTELSYEVRAARSSAFLDMIQDSQLRKELEDVEWTALHPGKALWDTFGWTIYLSFAISLVTVYFFPNL